MKKALFTVLLVVVIICMAVSVSAAEYDASGYVGDLQWGIKNGKLTIWGEGPMRNLSSYDDPDTWRNDDLINTITSIEIKEGVESIGEYAFDECINVRSVIIPGSVTEIGEGSFAEINKLEYVVFLGDAPKYMGNYAFVQSALGRTLEYCYLSDKNGWNNYTGDSLYATNYKWVPDTESGTVGKINWALFGTHLVLYGNGIINNFDGEDDSSVSPWFYYDNITSLFLCEGITSIGNNAFLGYEHMTVINLPNSLTKIGNDAFYGCEELKQIKLPDNVKTIGNCAFSVCTSLETAELSESLTTIGEAAFQDCTSLREVKLKGNLNTIKEFAFSSCENLSQINLPASLSNIGEHAFIKCSKLGKIIIPGKIKTIKDSAFIECASLSEVVISEGVEGIEGFAFYGCSALKSVQLPSTLTTIDKDSFGGREDLISFTVAEGNRKYFSEEGKLLKYGNVNNDYLIEKLDGENEIIKTDLINSRDVALAARYVAGFDLSNEEVFYPKAIDVDGDHEITPRDVMILSRYVAGWYNYSIPYLLK